MTCKCVIARKENEKKNSINKKVLGQIIALKLPTASAMPEHRVTV